MTESRGYGRVLKNRVTSTLKQSGLYDLLRPRRFHAFCLGAPKTGTHSIATLFSGFRVAHEPLTAGTTEWVLAAHRGERSETEVRRYLRRRDRALHLELESSHLMAVFVPALVEMFPRARFILTVRDPRSWLDSVINQHLNYLVDMDHPSPWQSFYLQLRRSYHEMAQDHPEEESLLQELGLFTLHGYLGYWATHNDRILASAPDDRLLILRTDRLSDDLLRLAAFVGIPVERLASEAPHTYQAPHRHGVVDRLDEALIRQRIEQHCGGTLRELARRGVRFEDSSPTRPAPPGSRA